LAEAKRRTWRRESFSLCRPRAVYILAGRGPASFTPPARCGASGADRFTPALMGVTCSAQCQSPLFMQRSPAQSRLADLPANGATTSAPASVPVSSSSFGARQTRRRRSGPGGDELTGDREDPQTTRRSIEWITRASAPRLDPRRAWTSIEARRAMPMRACSILGARDRTRPQHQQRSGKARRPFSFAPRPASSLRPPCA
jgi:hypothetical protein